VVWVGAASFGSRYSRRGRRGTRVRLRGREGEQVGEKKKVNRDTRGQPRGLVTSVTHVMHDDRNTR
jgi:hypothetical protein